MEEILLRKEKQKKTINALLMEKDKLGSIIADIEEEVTLLKSNLDNVTKFVRMLNNGSDMLNEINQCILMHTVLLYAMTILSFYCYFYCF